MSINPFTGTGTASLNSTDETPATEHSQKTNWQPLDVTRGFALLGLLVVAIWDFGGFTTNQQIFYQRGHHGGNYALLTAVSVLFEGKMLALFALAFGAGIILFLTKEQPTSLGAPDAYTRRQLWLLIFGLFMGFI